MGAKEWLNGSRIIKDYFIYFYEDIYLPLKKAPELLNHSLANVSS